MNCIAFEMSWVQYFNTVFNLDHKHYKIERLMTPEYNFVWYFNLQKRSKFISSTMAKIYSNISICLRVISIKDRSQKWIMATLITYKWVYYRLCQMAPEKSWKHWLLVLFAVCFYPTYLWCFETLIHMWKGKLLT